MNRTLRVRVAAGAAALAVTALSAALWSTSRAAGQPAASQTAVRQEPLYFVQDNNGEVWVYQGGQPVERTGIPTRLLPRSDREALAQGISVAGRAALEQLLADLGS